MTTSPWALRTGTGLLAAALCLALLAGLSWHSASRSLHAARLAGRYQAMSATLDGMKMHILRAEAAQARYQAGRNPADRAQRDHALAAFGGAMRALDPARLEYSGHAARFKLLQQHARRRLAEWAVAPGAAARPPAGSPDLHRAAAALPDNLDAFAQDLAAREAQQLERLRAEGLLWEHYANTGFAMQVAVLVVALGLGVMAGRQLQASGRQRRSLLRRRTRIAEEERKRIARDMHDGLGQDLFALKLELARMQAGSIQPQHAGTAQMVRLVDEVMGNLRAIIHDLRPAALEHGLEAALRRQAEVFRRRAGAHCRLDLHLEPVALDDETATAVFRLLQEALSNILRHAGATRVWVELVQSAGTLRLSVRDNGCGFRLPADTAAGAGGGAFGLLGMRERAGACGGKLVIDSEPGRGTALVLAIPLHS